jgi:hypothetical protein
MEGDGLQLRVLGPLEVTERETGILLLSASSF